MARPVGDVTVLAVPPTGASRGCRGLHEEGERNGGSRDEDVVAMARRTRAESRSAAMLTLASTLEAARSQMAFTLGFHIILASVGVAFPALMLIANYRGLRHGDEDALVLAQRWSKVVAVTFAVGAVTGTVL